MSAPFVPYPDENGDECWVALDRIVAVRPGPRPSRPVSLPGGSRMKPEATTEIVVDVGRGQPASIKSSATIEEVMAAIHRVAERTPRESDLTMHDLRRGYDD